MILYLLGLIIGILSFIRLKIGLILLFFCIILIIKKYKKKDVLIFLSFLVLGFSLSLFAYIKINSTHIKTLGIIIYSKENYVLVWAKFQKYYFYIKDNQYQKFDIIFIDSKTIENSFSFYESQFDFNKYLANKGVYQTLDNPKINDVFLFPIRLSKVRIFLMSIFSEDAKIIGGKLIFNYSYSKEWDKTIYSNNLSYYFFVSSFQIYFFLNFLERILIKKHSEKKVENILFLILIIIYFFTGYKNSILKIIVFKGVYLINKRIDKFNFSRVDSISLSWIILLILNPTLLLDSSFLIIFFLSYFSYYSSFSKNYIPKKYRSLYIGILIQLFFLPYNISNNYNLSLFNLLIPFAFAPFILIYEVLFIFFGIIRLPYLINIFSKFIKKIVFYIDVGNVFIVIGEQNILFYLIYYFILIMTVFLIEKKRYIKIIDGINMLIILILFSSIPLKNFISYEVDFINVGQGDSILVRYGTTTFLIDVGGNKSVDLAKETLIPYLNKKKISKLNAVFITHNDYDHAGSLNSLISNFRIDNIYYNSFEKMKIGEIEISNLNYFSSGIDDKNESSMVIYLNLCGHKFLFMGDAPKEIERKIVLSYPELDVDYLKVGHHGSNTSTSGYFLDVVTPKEAIISVGRNNIYGHPHKEVISILKNKGIKISRTDQEGTIEYIWVK